MGIATPIMTARPNDNTNPDEIRVSRALARSLGLAKESKLPNNRIRIKNNIITLAKPTNCIICDAMSVPKFHKYDRYIVDPAGAMLTIAMKLAMKSITISIHDLSPKILELPMILINSNL